MMKSSTLRALVAAAGFALVAACSSPMGMSRTAGAAASLSALDRTFISQAAYGSLSEVALGRLAEEKAASADVRAFGRTMVAEHARMTEELVDLATDKGVAPPTAPDPGRQAVTSMMGGLSWAAFDRQYVAQQLAEHEVTLTLLRGEARSGQDRDVRAFAERHVPVIERHLARLRELETQTVSAR